GHSELIGERASSCATASRLTPELSKATETAQLALQAARAIGNEHNRANAVKRVSDFIAELGTSG
ncbi:MAG TPA: hypothetical protein VNS56_08640, partial [Methylomirabilota bacterium]|nr:hypothetical protein [Methylomirabilota bacterium]